MTASEFHTVSFTATELEVWSSGDPRRTNWPVVYTIDGRRKVYVGETTQLVTRMRQHLKTKSRRDFGRVRAIVNDTFNKSVCLDLESYLIRMFAGDGKYDVANANVGLTESNYFLRGHYRAMFEGIFDQLREDGLFEQSAADIENSALFKFSPFKSLTYDQRIAVLSIVESLVADRGSGTSTVSVVNGGPGTGKTIVAIYLLKLIADIGQGQEFLDPDGDAILGGLFNEGNQALLADLTLGIVIPQKALRKTVKRVFTKTPGLRSSMVLSPYTVMNSGKTYDLLIVDEAHRLQQLASTMPSLIPQFKRINRELFGDEKGGDQLDWLRRRSRQLVLMLDTDQTVRPADIPSQRFEEIKADAARSDRLFDLKTQMRVQAGEDYVEYIRSILTAQPSEAPIPQSFPTYETALFDDLNEMKAVIDQRESEHQLSRLVAGYAWEYKSKNDKNAVDIELDGLGLQWNQDEEDWISSVTSVNEVGSIHTVQGYDLNYAGVIIGPDLRYDDQRGIHVDRASYRDTKGKQNNGMLGLTYDDDDLRTFITNIYRVLLTRGILGTFVYVCDPGLREYLRPFFPAGTTLLAGDLMFSEPLPVEWNRAAVDDLLVETPPSQSTHLTQDPHR